MHVQPASSCLTKCYEMRGRPGDRRSVTMRSDQISPPHGQSVTGIATTATRDGHTGMNGHHSVVTGDSQLPWPHSAAVQCSASEPLLCRFRRLTGGPASSPSLPAPREGRATGHPVNIMPQRRARRVAARPGRCRASAATACRGASAAPTQLMIPGKRARAHLQGLPADPLPAQRARFA